MPQTDILFNRSEHEDLVRYVLDQGAWLVPSRLTSATVTRIADLSLYRTQVDGHEKLFHIQHPSFERTRGGRIREPLSHVLESPHGV